MSDVTLQPNQPLDQSPTAYPATPPQPSPESGVTPEEVAGFVSRGLALVIDLVFLATAMISITVVSSLLINTFLLGSLTEWLVDRVILVVNIMLPALYTLFFWTLAGQTPGKGIMGIQVVREDGSPLKIKQAALRLVGYVASSFLLLGFLWVLIDPRRQTLHDKIAKTFVIYSGRRNLSPRRIRIRR